MFDMTTEQTMMSRRAIQPQAEFCTVQVITNRAPLYARNQMRDTRCLISAMEAMMLADPINWTGHGAHHVARTPYSSGKAA